MAYNPFDDSKPTPADNGTVAFDETRYNLHAMRDAVVLGVMPGWNMTPSGGTNEQPAELEYSNGSEWLKAALTWGSSGGADGNVTQAVYTHSTDDIIYDTIATLTINYNSDGTVQSTVWS